MMPSMLKAHVVEKEGPIYDLIVAKGRLKVVKAEPDPPRGDVEWTTCTREQAVQWKDVE
jgi:hypothetical protein